MGKLNYKTLSTEIVKSIAEIDDYEIALNTAITTYKTHVTERLNEKAAEILNIRKILVDVFRDVNEADENEAINMMAERFKKEFNSVKRRERYKRELALQEGKEYVSDLVKFGNIDETKIVKDDVQHKSISKQILSGDETDEEIFVSDDPNVLDMLNQKIEVEKLGQQQQQQHIPLTDIFTNEEPYILPINRRPESLPSSNDKVVPNLFNFNSIYIPAYQYNNEYLQDKDYQLFRINIHIKHDQKSVFLKNNFLPLEPIINSCLEIPKIYHDRRTDEMITNIDYVWEFYFVVAIKEPISNIVNRIKEVYPVYETAIFNIRPLKRLHPTFFINVVQY